MTPEDIDKLADEYADKECAMSRHTGKKLKQLHEDKIIEFYDVFGFLIERFCIVEKSKVLAEYTGIEEEVKYVNGRYTMTSDIPMIIQSKLRCIFGKDMFEEEGE